MTPVYAAVFGLAFGSFAVAAIGRIPRGRSLNGRSQCDACSRTLRATELIPVLSYILLRGRCATCRERIGLHAPAIEAVSGMVFAAAFWSLPTPFAVAGSVAFVMAAITVGVGGGVGIGKRGAHA